MLRIVQNLKYKIKIKKRIKKHNLGEENLLLESKLAKNNIKIDNWKLKEIV